MTKQEPLDDIVIANRYSSAIRTQLRPLDIYDRDLEHGEES